MSNFVINCKVCEKQVDLIQDDVDDFRCPTCNSYYSSESGVWDKLLVEDMYKIYQGAKTAGLIKEEDVYEENYHE